jgi:hypothetical protein
MKAKEYAEKYRTIIESSDHYQSILIDDVITPCIKEFMNESVEIIKIRKISKIASMISVYKELNQKWNIFIDMFPFYLSTRKNMFAHIAVLRLLDIPSLSLIYNYNISSEVKDFINEYKETKKYKDIYFENELQEIKNLKENANTIDFKTKKEIDVYYDAIDKRLNKLKKQYNIETTIKE